MTGAANLSRLQGRHWALVALATATGVAAGEPPPGSILLGGATIGLVTVVYAGVARIVLRRQRPSLAIALLFVKLAAFLGLGWLAFASGEASRPDPIGFALGLSCFLVAAVWEAMRARRGD